MRESGETDLFIAVLSMVPAYLLFVRLEFGLRLADETGPIDDAVVEPNRYE